MAQRRDDWSSVTAIGREVECIQQRQFAPTQEPAGGIVTAQADLRRRTPDRAYGRPRHAHY